MNSVSRSCTRRPTSWLNSPTTETHKHERKNSAMNIFLVRDVALGFDFVSGCARAADTDTLPTAPKPKRYTPMLVCKFDVANRSVRRMDYPNEKLTREYYDEVWSIDYRCFCCSVSVINMLPVHGSSTGSHHSQPASSQIRSARSRHLPSLLCPRLKNDG